MSYFESNRLHVYPEPLCYVRTWILERLISFNGASGDSSGAIMLLVLRVFIVLWVCGQQQLARWLRKWLRKPHWAGDRFRGRSDGC